MVNEATWIWSDKYGQNDGGLDTPIYLRNKKPLPIIYTVTFEDYDGTELKVEEVSQGGDATPPANPTRSGYTFTGWSGNYTDVMEDVTIIATYSENDSGGGGTTSTSSPTIDAVADQFTTTQNSQLVIETSELIANDEDYETFESVQNPTDGTVSLSGTTVTFTPDLDFTGTAYFYYTIADGSDEDTTIVTVTVEEGIIIEEETTPLGPGDPDALIILEPEMVPLGTIDFSLPYIIGYPDVSFRPEREITRGEMAVIFARILSRDKVMMSGETYDDVSADDWYYTGVEVATALGIMEAKRDNEFKPNWPLTHGEMAQAFSNYWDLMNVEISTEGGHYSDIEGHALEDEVISSITQVLVLVL